MSITTYFRNYTLNGSLLEFQTKIKNFGTPCGKELNGHQIHYFVSQFVF